MVQAVKQHTSVHVQPHRNETGRSVSTLGAWTFPNQAEGGSIKLGRKVREGL